MTIMTQVFNKMMEKDVKEIQKIFEQEIDVLRHIQMKKYLDLYQEYMGGMGMTLKLLNIWIQDFLSKYIKEENENGTA